MNYKRNIIFIFIVIAILSIELYIFSHTQFTLWPEMVLYPWLINHGFLLYKDIINPYFPLLNWMFGGLTKILGYNLQVFVWFTWGYILLTQLFFVYLTQKLFRSTKISIISLFFYATLLIIFEGNGLWFDLFCTLPLLVAYYFLTKKESWQKYLIAGVCLGIGVLIKQTVIWVIILLIIDQFIFRLLKIHNTKYLIHNAFLLIMPTAIMIVGAGLVFYVQGIFRDFFFWSIKLPFGVLQRTPGFVEWPTRRNIIIIVIIFCPSIIYLPKIIHDRRLTLSFIFFVSTFFFAFPRFGYFHLVTCIPFFAVITARIFSDRPIERATYMIIVTCLLVVFLRKNIPVSIRFFDMNIYKLASDIQKEVKGESLFLQNSPQQIYFINNVLPPKPWAINFPWYLEGTNLQQRIISSIEKNSIKYVIFENYQRDMQIFTPGTYTPKKIQNYLDQHFVRKKKIEGNIYLYEKNI